MSYSAVVEGGGDVFYGSLAFLLMYMNSQWRLLVLLVASVPITTTAEYQVLRNIDFYNIPHVPGPKSPDYLQMLKRRDIWCLISPEKTIYHIGKYWDLVKKISVGITKMKLRQLKLMSSKEFYELTENDILKIDISKWKECRNWRSKQRKTRKKKTGNLERWWNRKAQVTVCLWKTRNDLQSCFKKVPPAFCKLVCSERFYLKNSCL